MKDTKSTRIISKMFVSLFVFFVIAAMYLIMAENRSSSEPVILSLRGSRDDDSIVSETQFLRSLEEEEKTEDTPSIEGMTVTIPAPKIRTGVRRFYFNGNTAYCVCDNRKCKEIQKKQEDNIKNDTDPVYRYRDHLQFMKTSLLHSGIKEKEKDPTKNPDPDNILNATLYDSNHVDKYY